MTKTGIDNVTVLAEGKRIESSVLGLFYHSRVVIGDKRDKGCFQRYQFTLEFELCYKIVGRNTEIKLRRVARIEWTSFSLNFDKILN